MPGAGDVSDVTVSMDLFPGPQCTNSYDPTVPAEVRYRACAPTPWPAPRLRVLPQPSCSCCSKTGRLKRAHALPAAAASAQATRCGGYEFLPSLALCLRRTTTLWVQPSREREEKRGAGKRGRQGGREAGRGEGRNGGRETESHRNET